MGKHLIIKKRKMTEQAQTVWRESASLILAGRCDKEAFGDKYDYELLLLKRSDRTAIIPNQTVFPGGMFDAFDESVEWLEYFEQFGVTQEQLKQLVVLKEERPRILAPQGNGCYDRFFKRSQIWAREISLRITAIREAFEEVGVLLCRSREQLNASGNYAYVREDFDKFYWQQLVHNDPKQFLRLCQELKVVPDLWSLYEWSAWASPAPVKKGSETAFFIAFVDKQPNLLIESSEVKECMWHSPPIYLQLHHDGELWFMPPQIYEISRLIAVRKIAELSEFAKQRSNNGVILFLPVGYACTDGMVMVYPGDDYYVPDPRSATKFKSTNLTTSEFRANTKRLHRFEFFGTPDAAIRLNFEPQNGHLAPVMTTVVQHKL